MQGTGWNGENLVDHEIRIGTLEVADTTLSASVGCRQSQNHRKRPRQLADIQRDQTLANQSEAKSELQVIMASWHCRKMRTGNLKMKREGLTARNLVENGDFSLGLLGGVIGASVPSITDKIMSATGDGSQSYMALSQGTVTAIIGDTYVI